MKNIIIVEDDTVMAGLLQDRLDDDNIEINILTNGDELQYYMKTRDEPDYIILDLMLSEESGIDFLINLRDQWKNAKIYIFTAYPEYREQYPVINYYIDGFFSKLQLNELIEEIKSK